MECIPRITALDFGLMVESCKVALRQKQGEAIAVILIATLVGLYNACSKFKVSAKLMIPKL
jgi:hypothetical protein